MYATATVERLNAKVKTPAGTFEQCLEMKTVFERKGEDPSEIYQKLNVQNSGTRRVWFAPGVGVIKLIYQHGDGVETEAQLMDYEGLKSTNDYFPLQVDARWHYRVKNTYSDQAVRDTWWITVQNDNTFYYGHYVY